MDRRHFLKTSATIAGTAVATGCAPSPSGDGPAVISRPSITWRLASSFPRSLDTIYGGAEVLAERVEALSEGKFRIRVYPAGEIVPALQVMDAAQQGTVQIGQTASYYFTGKNPSLAFDACVPFGLTSRQQTAWLKEGGGLELMREQFADFGLINFPAGTTGAQMGGWFRREVATAADLDGLKMRIPGLGGQVMSRLGVTVQVLPGGEIYPALERGAIDATEWVGPYDDEKLGFHKVARYYYYPGWWEPGPSLTYMVNRAAWDKIPAVYREIFTTAATQSAETMQARYDQRNPQALARLLDDGVELRRFSDDLMDAAQRATTDILEENAAKDGNYRAVYESWKRARREAFQWSSTAELAYARFAFEQS
ncbi:MAG: TRAP transporter substrate-binding protein [Acidobacteriota bacterium]